MDVVFELSCSVLRNVIILGTLMSHVEKRGNSATKHPAKTRIFYGTVVKPERQQRSEAVPSRTSSQDQWN